MGSSVHGRVVPALSTEAGQRSRYVSMASARHSTFDLFASDPKNTLSLRPTPKSRLSRLPGPLPDPTLSSIASSWMRRRPSALAVPRASSAFPILRKSRVLRDTESMVLCSTPRPSSFPPQLPAKPPLPSTPIDDQERYSRQILFPGIGVEGQARLAEAHVCHRWLRSYRCGGGRIAGTRRSRNAHPHRSRFRRALQPSAPGTLRRSRCICRRFPRPKPHAARSHSSTQASRFAPTSPTWFPTTSPASRHQPPHPRRDRQLRDPLSHQRLCRATGQAMDLCGRHWGVCGHHEYSSPACIGF